MRQLVFLMMGVMGLCVGCGDDGMAPARQPTGFGPTGQTSPAMQDTTASAAGNAAPAPTGNETATMTDTAATAIMCEPACVVPEVCNTATGTCAAPPATGCPSGCADAEICQDGACVPAPSEGSVDAQCVAEAMAVNSTTTEACATCLCTAGTGCLAELSACTSDGAPCGDLVDCGAVKECEGSCCLCNPASAPATGAPCGALGENLNTGVCADEIAMAAGLSPGGINLFNATMVAEQCAVGGGTPCAHATEFGVCAAEKCADVCTLAPTCVTN
ncbi:MAG: hypothetical protein OEZ06_23360 [Myxococcales bacterium]|nr:hypothetical protein [Myxococcales bacterium]